MSSPDLAALRALVEAVDRSEIDCLATIHATCLHDLVPAAQAVLNRLEETSAALHADETGHLHRCLHLRSTEPPRWSCAEGCAVQRAEKAEARLARLETALRETLEIVRVQAPDVYEALDVACATRYAVLEERDERA